MTLKEYTDYIIRRLLQQFPEFEDCINYKDDIATIEYWSNLRRLNLWITTQDSEITIGFEGKEPKWDWHTHMSLYNAYEPDDEIIEANKLIQDIMADKEFIICSNIKGFTLTSNVDDEILKKESNEIIAIKKWSEL